MIFAHELLLSGAEPLLSRAGPPPGADGQALLAGGSGPGGARWPHAGARSAAVPGAFEGRGDRAARPGGARRMVGALAAPRRVAGAGRQQLVLRLADLSLGA